jgi:hypothetical protein
MQEAKISLLERENYVLSNKSSDDKEKNELLEHNLKRFEEERKMFEREKLKFLEEKRELDRLRLQRFERYKRELEARRIGLRPNYDIDNPNDYMVARKIVIENMNERLTEQQQQMQQDSGSDSEPDITVVENLPKTIKKLEAKVESDDVITTDEVTHDNSIKIDDTQQTPSSENTKVSEVSHLNGKELPNGMEKSTDHIAVENNAPKAEIIVEKIEIDEKNPIRFWLFIKMLFRETRQIWNLHSNIHELQYRYIKVEYQKCLSHLILLLLICGLGGIFFQYVEGNYELMNKAGVKRVKRDFIDQLWLSSHNLR